MDDVKPEIEVFWVASQKLQQLLFSLADLTEIWQFNC